MRKDITSFNNQEQPHGYWEIYWSDDQIDFGGNSISGQLFYMGNYINGKEDGWWESYWSDGQLDFKGNYINGKEDGWWIENDYKKLDFYL